MNRRAENLAPPPRKVPWTLSLRVLLGDGLTLFGWILYCFGMIFVLVFGRNLNVADLTSFHGNLSTVPGVVVEVEDTSMEVNEEEVVGWLFTYEVEGQRLEGFCYTNGWDHAEGKAVTVEFPTGQPTRARIVGSRLSEVPFWLLPVIGIFPAVGLLCVVFGVRGGLKGQSLLSRGVLARGRLQGKTPTNMTVNDQTVYELSFAFSPPGFSREFLCKARTHQTESLEDEAEEPLLYLESDPQRAVMLDSLPGGGGIGADGKFQAPGLIVTLLILLGPLVGSLMTALAVSWILLD